MTGEEERNPKLVDVTSRFSISLVLVPLLFLAMSEGIISNNSFSDNVAGDLSTTGSGCVTDF